MKGLVYYSVEGSIKNKSFIDDLIVEAHTVGIELIMLVGDEEPLEDTSFVLFRDRNPSLSKKFELQGFKIFNSSEVNRIANNKLLTYQFALSNGIPAVPTTIIQSIDEIYAFPIVLKTIDGYAGSEVYLCANATKAAKLFQKFEHREMIAQPYIESGAQDIRVFIVGQDIVGAVKRTGTDSFKSNYSQGGTIEKYILSPEQEKDALKIAYLLNSDYIGVDFLLLEDGSWLLNEIEDPVGARSLYKTHDFSIAGKLMRYIQKSLQYTHV